MRLDPSSIDPRETYKLMIGLIVPRPIAWVGTVGAAGRKNLAPFSYFMGVTGVPPTICFSVVDREGEKKDTLRNLEEASEFTLNVVSEAVGERIDADALAAIGRMAGDTYCRTRDRFDMKRPVIKR